MSDKPNCEICGEPMPDGEEMFKYHGYSGDCPKPPLPKGETPRTDALLREINEGRIYEIDGPVADHSRKLERELSQQSAREKDLMEAARKVVKFQPSALSCMADLERALTALELRRNVETELTACRQERDAEMEGILKLREECGAKDNECFPDFVRRLHKELAELQEKHAELGWRKN